MSRSRTSRNRAASSGSIIATARAAPRSMRARPIRSTFPSCRSTTTSSSSISTSPRTASIRSVPDLAESWAWSSDNKTLTFKLRAGRQMARRQAVHVGRRQMHLRHADGQVAAKIPAEPAQVLVRPGQRRDDQRRLRGLVQSEAAAAGAVVAARLRLYADLSLPCLAGRHAHQPDRHRPVQVRRVQGQRIDQARRRTRTTSRRACPISTASNSPSSRTARPRSWASSPASST